MPRIRTTFPRAGDLTLLGAHSSHSYQTGTNLYFVYDYDIRCEPARGDRALPPAAQRDRRRGGAAGRRLDGAPPRRRQVPHAVDRRRSTAAPMLLYGLKRAFDPHNIMNPGSVFPIDEQVDAVLDDGLGVTTTAGRRDGATSSPSTAARRARRSPWSTTPGRVHASRRAPLRPYALGPGGRAVHPDDDLWDSLCVAPRGALASFAGEPDGHRRGRAVRDPVLPRAAGRRGTPHRAGAELDGRPGRPAAGRGGRSGGHGDQRRRLPRDPADR